MNWLLLLLFLMLLQVMHLLQLFMQLLLMIYLVHLLLLLHMMLLHLMLLLMSCLLLLVMLHLVMLLLLLELTVLMLLLLLLLHLLLQLQQLVLGFGLLAVRHTGHGVVSWEDLVVRRGHGLLGGTESQLERLQHGALHAGTDGVRLGRQLARLVTLLEGLELCMTHGGSCRTLIPLQASRLGLGLGLSLGLLEGLIGALRRLL